MERTYSPNDERPAGESKVKETKAQRKAKARFFRRQRSRVEDLRIVPEGEQRPVWRPAPVATYIEEERRRRRAGLLTVYEIQEDERPEQVKAGRLRHESIIEPAEALPYIVSGNVAFTLERGNDRYSYLVTAPRRSLWSPDVAFYVDLLCGPINAIRREPVGVITKAYTFLAANDTPHAGAVTLFTEAFIRLINDDKLPGGMVMRREDRCQLCHRMIWSGRSVAARCGDRCRKKIQQRVVLIKREVEQHRRV